MNRREFLGAVPVVAVLRGISAPHPNEQTKPLSQQSAADHIVRIATGLVETAPNRFIATTLYNGQFPGPVLRLRQGVPVTVDVYNDTDTPEQIHWHGLPLPIDVDGSAEEGTPFIPPHGFRRVTFTPELAGMRL